MDEAIRQEWRRGDPEYSFPTSGLLVETQGPEVRGALGFRPASRESGNECEIVHIVHGGGVNWADLIERIVAQAPKGKYTTAHVSAGPALPRELEEALRAAGFRGDPLSRALSCDAPKHLQPYLDWDGRLIRLSAGKGSEAINAELLAHIASRFPSQGRYTEKEVNATLRQLSRLEDYVALRRDLVDRGHLARTPDGKAYWKVTTE